MVIQSDQFRRASPRFRDVSMEQKGVSAASVSDAMGQASVGITIDLYENVVDDSWSKLE